MKKENTIRRIFLIALELFAVFSAILFLSRQQFDRLPMCLGLMMLLLLPRAVERRIRCRMTTGMYILCLFYALGSMLGNAWKLYYVLPGWDKLLHLTGGVVFAVLGLFLAERLSGDHLCRLPMKVVFALFFSVAVSAIWEMVEYGADFFLSTDMQKDTVISALRSGLLGEGMGAIQTIEPVAEVVVNGRELGLGGYLDIGLIDTMGDMLWESLGAVLYTAYFSLTGGKRELILPTGKSDANEGSNREKG